MQAVAGPPKPDSAPHRPRQDHRGPHLWPFIPRSCSPAQPSPVSRSGAPGLLLLLDLAGMTVGKALPSDLGEGLAHSPVRGHQGPGSEANDRKRLPLDGA